MKTIAQKMAEYALNLKFGQLPAETIQQAKRVLLDTLGCGIAGSRSPAARVILNTVPMVGGPPEATILMSGWKSSCMNAALANGAMVRYLDLNDWYIVQGDAQAGGHPSEIIPPILAVAERQHSSGAEVIEAIVAGYELSARFTDGCTVGRSLESRGWNSDLRAGFIVPPVIGKLLGLNSEQVENAIGIAGSMNMVLGVLDAPKEEYTMAKNLRYPLCAFDAILATFLARGGFTGPRRVMEGQRGFVESVLGGDFDLETFSSFKGFKIMQTGFKGFVADATTHGHLTATLMLVREHDLKPEDIAAVKVRGSSRDIEHTGAAEKRYPRNKETADHSSYFLTAIAIAERSVGPQQFAPEKFEDPTVLDLIKKITLEPDPSLDGFVAAGISEITTKSGRTFRQRVDYPRGDPKNPMTEKDLRAKFYEITGTFMMRDRAERAMDLVMELENLRDIHDLMKWL